jgi:transcriptional regulator with XRE-family HTH domain
MPRDDRKLLALGKNLRARREALRLSQESLADRCGFDRTYISMLERGRRNPAFLNLIVVAKGLDLPLSTLVIGI